MALTLPDKWIWDSWYVRDRDLWHGFFLGVLAHEAGVGRRLTPALLALCVVTLLGATRVDAVFGTPCALTALFLLWAARTGHLDRGLAEAGLALCDSGEAFHIPEATHWVQHEEPERVNRSLIEFLTGDGR